MKSAREIKMLRCGKGFFTAQDVVDALSKEGIELKNQQYLSKENGRTKFSAKEIRAMAKLLGLDLDEAIDIFS